MNLIPHLKKLKKRILAFLISLLCFLLRIIFSIIVNAFLNKIKLGRWLKQNFLCFYTEFSCGMLGNVFVWVNALIFFILTIDKKLNFDFYNLFTIYHAYPKCTTLTKKI